MILHMLSAAFTDCHDFLQFFADFIQFASPLSLARIAFLLL